MDSLAGYRIPIGGLDDGKHDFRFRIDDYFLEACSSPYDRADVDADVALDKRNQLCVLEVKLQGNVDCMCDRCTVPISLPVKGAYRVILKEVHEHHVKADDEIIFIHPGQSYFSISKLLHDVFLLAIPMQKIYDCTNEKNPPCDFDILDRLNAEANQDEKSEPSIWDDIKEKINIK